MKNKNLKNLKKVWAVQAIWKEKATEEQIALALSSGLVIKIDCGIGFQCTQKYYDLKNFIEEQSK